MLTRNPSSATLAGRIARYMTDLSYDQIPQESLHAAKRLIADSIACAAAGWSREATGQARRVFPEISGPLQASIWGDGQKAWAPAAAFVNGTMVREPEINDTFTAKTPAHPSESIPTAVALCEGKERSGKDLLTAVIGSYEIYGRLCYAAKIVGGNRGWHHTTFGIVVIPALAAKCLGQPFERMLSAISFSSSFGITLNQLHLGNTSSLRSLVYPMAALSSTVATLLTEAGATGPDLVLEGEHGFFPQLVGEDYDTAPFEEWEKPMILESSIKLYSCSYYIHTALEAFRKVVQEQKLRAEDITKVVVELTQRPFEVVAQSSRVRPETIEAADHSLTFALGLLATRGTVYPMDFTPEVLNDQAVLDFAQRIEIKVNPELDREYPLHKARPAIVTVHTARGPAGSATSIYPEGDFRAPVSDEGLRRKFGDLTAGWYGQAQADRVWNAIFELERAGEVGSFVRTLIPEKRP